MSHIDYTPSPEEILLRLKGQAFWQRSLSEVARDEQLRQVQTVVEPKQPDTPLANPNMSKKTR